MDFPLSSLHQILRWRRENVRGKSAAEVEGGPGVGGAEEGEITPDVIDQVIAAADRSVTPDMLHRFDAWAAQASA